jgi:hypothetical protein
VVRCTELRHLSVGSERARICTELGMGDLAAGWWARSSKGVGQIRQQAGQMRDFRRRAQM